MKGEVRILLLEDAVPDAELTIRELRQAGMVCNVRRVETERDFVRSLTEFSPDVILSDFSLPQFNGMAALGLSQSVRGDVPFIFVSGTIGEEAAIEALTHGASDYVLKGNLKRLPAAVRRVLREATDRVERHRSEQARIHAEQRYYSLVELSPDAILLVQEGRIVLINEAGLRLYGATRRDQMVGRLLLDFIHAESRGEVTTRMHRLHLVGERLPRLEQKHLRLDGSVVDVELASVEIEYGGHKVALVIARDISERKRDQEKQAQLLGKLQDTITRLDRVSRIRTVLSSINGAILRIRDQQTLLDEVCRIAVEEGRLLLAWVMMIDGGGAWLEFRSHAGVGRECFEGLRIPLSPHKDGDLGPTREAVLKGEAVVWDNIQEDSSRPSWQERARALGYRSAIALPLRVEGLIVGAFTFCAEENGFFTEEQKRLLLELAADAGLGLDYMRRVAEVERLAYYDPLTGLAKPTLVEDRLRQSLARARRTARPVAVVVVNLVQLREFNLRFGRGVTDVVVRSVADELSRSLRSEDTVGRLDVFDFILVLAEIASSEDVPNVIRRTYATIPRSLRIGVEELPVRVRLGAAVFPGDGDTAEELIRNASIASTRASPTEGDDVAFYSDGALSGAP